MLNLIPRHTPPLSVLMDDLRLTPASMARVLQVSERSVYRWMSKDHAPRAVMLSLFFVSRWGVGLVACESENAARMWAGFARCLMAERGAGVPLFDLSREAANSSRWARFRPSVVRG
jgi:hypothetical protein